MENRIAYKTAKKVAWECARTREESHSYQYQVKSSHATIGETEGALDEKYVKNKLVFGKTNHALIILLH